MHPKHSLTEPPLFSAWEISLPPLQLAGKETGSGEVLKSVRRNLPRARSDSELSPAPQFQPPPPQPGAFQGQLLCQFLCA